MKFTTPYTHTDERSAQFGTINNEESLTQQSDAAECDINIIMEKYGKSGQLPQIQQEPLYGDFSDAMDYRTAIELVQHAREAFAEVPAKVRKEFDNDPAKYMEFINNPENIEEMKKMGLAIPKAPQPATLDTVTGELKSLNDKLTPKEIGSGQTK